jgi:alpha-galactosidase
MGAASFQIVADGKVVAQSGLVKSEDPARALSANLTGAQWLQLVTQLGDPSYGPVAPAVWARPLLTCGTRTGASRPQIAIFSFDSGTESFTLANPGTGGSFSASKAFHTDGSGGLEVTSPADGNWFGRSFLEPLDLSGTSELAFDVKTGSAGTVGEFAVQVGAGSTWCQGGRWAWVNPHSTKTIKTAFSEMSCPGGVRLDLAQIKAVWVFLKGGTFVIDQVRAE